MKKHLLATLLALTSFAAFAEQPLIEKDLSLAIAQALYARCSTMNLEKTVLLTREGDVALSQKARADFVSNAHKDASATLLVSIHLNFSLNSATRGFEVYYGRSPEFALSIAHALEREIGTYSPFRGAKEEQFLALASTDAHAALVECGFISNPTEAALLAAPDYRQKIVTGIANGIEQFIANNPAVAVIVIDPAHGGADSGAIAAKAVPQVNASSNQIFAQTFVSPLREWTLASPFGVRAAPLTGIRMHHSGIDMSAPLGTPVYATCAGTVTDTGFSQTYGNYIIIGHDNSYSTFYAYLDAISVKNSQQVEQGAQIARVGGAISVETGEHLHFAVYKNGRSIDPFSVLPTAQ